MDKGFGYVRGARVSCPEQQARAPGKPLSNTSNVPVGRGEGERGGEGLGCPPLNARLPSVAACLSNAKAPVNRSRHYRPGIGDGLLCVTLLPLCSRPPASHSPFWACGCVCMVVCQCTKALIPPKHVLGTVAITHHSVLVLASHWQGRRIGMASPSDPNTLPLRIGSIFIVAGASLAGCALAVAVEKHNKGETRAPQTQRERAPHRSLPLCPTGR